MAKRKRASLASDTAALAVNPMPPPTMIPSNPPTLEGRTSSRMRRTPADLQSTPGILDGVIAESASPDAVPLNIDEADSPLSDPPEDEPPKKQRRKKGSVTATKAGGAPVTPAKTIPALGRGDVETLGDPEADGDEEVGEEEIQQAISRPPPVNSDYLPLPWKGRLGYACLNTYLRYSHPPVFSSRTCRIASILEHRHPLTDPKQPEHATKNRPDKTKPADIARGQKWVESLGLQNARDIIKMLRWNDRYGIKFMRLSSEMFPFASHEEYGYKLAPFAADTLAAVGKVVAELGHRVTTHPGQFTQLGSPRKQVVENAIRDLEYHDEMLTLLNLPPQQDRDAVMILHMGGIFGSKPETIERFKENYAKLSPSIKRRLVLENDDMGWSVHDLLPVCQELNIPLVLDFHHHNIIFDADQIREGTKDIMELYPTIKETWTRKGITQKMHYSEPCPGAITGRQRRKHSPRVMTLPPCAADMDLMIEAKDKEQAVFELMRTFKLPGFDRINEMTPYTRYDDNRLLEKSRGRQKTTPKKKRGKVDATEDDEDEMTALAAAAELKAVPEEEIGMGGPEGRVYWPPGMEEWLRPKKREIKKKDPNDTDLKTPRKRAAKAKLDPEVAVEREALRQIREENADVPVQSSTPKKKSRAARTKKEKSVPTPSTSDDDTGEIDFEQEEVSAVGSKPKRTAPIRKSRRSAQVSYVEADEGTE